MNKKFELTSNTKTQGGVTLYQIKAKISFGIVKAGELGGYIEKESNLSEEGDAWVYGNACVYGDARVYGNACVYGNARVYGNACVYGNAWVYGNARVYGNAWVYGDARVYGDACVYGDAQLNAKASFTLGQFMGGDDTGKITEITEKTGSTCWNHQYVLGDYKITPIEEEVAEVIETIEIGGVKYNKKEFEEKVKDLKPVTN